MSTREMSINSRKRIENVAAKGFAVRGYNGISIREIAEKAGVTKPTIYYHYKSKDDLFLSVLEGAISSLHKRIQEVESSQGPPMEKIREIVRIYIRMFQEEEDIFRLVHTTVTTSDKHARPLTDKYFRRIHAIVKEIIRQGIEEGSFREEDPEKLALTAIGIVIFYFSEALVIYRIAESKEEMRRFLGALDLHIARLLAR